MFNIKPYRWQQEAFRIWREIRRGIVAVVTGAGKTVFGLLCMDHFLASEKGKILVIVPTVPLMDQWRSAIIHRLGVAEESVAAVGGGNHGDVKNARIIVAVVNSAREKVMNWTQDGKWLLVADECHRFASNRNRAVLSGRFAATLGLSATPEREYDDGLDTILIPKLGPIIYRYTYREALRDGIISMFELWNVRVPLLPREREVLMALNRRIAQEFSAVSAHDGHTSERLRRLLIRRGRLTQRVYNRIPATILLMEQFRGRRGLIFHEAVDAADRIATGLQRRGHRVKIYHTKLGPALRFQNLRLYEAGHVDVLVTCRALDEGFDVPDTEFGIIAASSASTRQRIQRLGRVLRRSAGKDRAIVISVYATDHEEERLLAESVRLREIADVRWFEVKGYEPINS